MNDPSFSALDDPSCEHRSHYECVACRKLVCARCGMELAAASDNWRTRGYWCADCLHAKAAGTLELVSTSTKTTCDGCGDEIKPWNALDPSADGLERALKISTGNNYQRWDLCDACQGRVANAIIDLLPHTPPENWIHAIRPKRHA